MEISHYCTIGLSEWKWGSPPRSGESQPTENTITKATGGVCCKHAPPASGIQELLQTARKRGLQTHLTSKYSQPQEKDRQEGQNEQAGSHPSECGRWRKALQCGAVLAFAELLSWRLSNLRTKRRAKVPVVLIPELSGQTLLVQIIHVFICHLTTIYEGPPLCPLVRGAEEAAVNPRGRTLAEQPWPTVPRENGRYYQSRRNWCAGVKNSNRWKCRAKWPLGWTGLSRLYLHFLIFWQPMLFLLYPERWHLLTREQ